jgi:tetraacyldisaccharide 4'-kinase
MIINQLWYKNNLFSWLLLPLAYIYQIIIFIRKLYLIKIKQQKLNIPIIVFGIVSRGYKAQIKKFPYLIQNHDFANTVGDEPLLIAQKTGLPVAIAPKRVDAVQFLQKKHHCQIIISDDGLQHYAMSRNIEIIIIDGMRGLGNQRCLPAGPLRENKKKLKLIDFLVVNSGVWPHAFNLKLVPENFINLINNQIVNLLPQCSIAAIAAIGNPERFFITLTMLGIKFKPYIFPDHYKFTAKDLNFSEKIVVMTEKDAVKCRPFATEYMYYLPVVAQLEVKFWDQL